MAPQKSQKKNHKAATPENSIAPTKSGVVKRRYGRVRFHENGLLNVERKKGKYFKMAQQNQRQSPLLRLPPELRNKIFTYALGGKTFEIRSISSKSYKIKRPRNERNDKHALALLQVCRQIYAETTLLPFSKSTFSTSFPPALNEWAKSLHPARAQSITWVELKIWSLFYNRTLVFLRLFKIKEPLLSALICNRGCVTLSLKNQDGLREEDIEELCEGLTIVLQKEKIGVNFVWELESRR